MENPIVAVFLLLLALRLGGAIDIPYVYVFLPLWLPLITILCLAVLRVVFGNGK